jgi:hypothetical protein
VGPRADLEATERERKKSFAPTGNRTPSLQSSSPSPLNGPVFIVTLSKRSVAACYPVAIKLIGAGTLYSPGGFI